jgi:hypothetical protein
VISMRRLAILFAILAAIGSIEHIVLSGTAARIIQAPRRIYRALIKLAGPIRVFQRLTARGSGPWLGQGN